eukprot:6191934-Pleurochrysis_carterae.AAC.1
MVTAFGSTRSMFAQSPAQRSGIDAVPTLLMGDDARTEAPCWQDGHAERSAGSVEAPLTEAEAEKMERATRMRTRGGAGQVITASAEKDSLPSRAKHALKRASQDNEQHNGAMTRRRALSDSVLRPGEVKEVQKLRCKNVRYAQLEQCLACARSRTEPCRFRQTRHVAVAGDSVVRSLRSFGSGLGYRLSEPSLGAVPGSTFANPAILNVQQQKRKQTFAALTLKHAALPLQDLVQARLPRCV